MQMNIPATFRIELRKQSLGWDSSEGLTSHFYFDLNDGPFFSRQDPGSVTRIIEIGYALDPSRITGEWSYLLELATPVSDLNNRSVKWERPYRIPKDAKPGSWITLRQWLMEQGQLHDEKYLRSP
ncbi:hypothetical protein KBA63_05205 [Candidatus Woesebacteria bacterium]|nr:hypothetical protein [Candidatus Woesebacteria bacterium]MBP9687598.1 hypothetical protein [Candidatus Woesebacteria bacterium]